MSKDQTGEEWSPAIPARYIAQVIAKLADGTYATEAARCFCGADFDDMVIVERDRFQIPHRTVMCRNCALIRANPRMTQKAYNQFYNNEYRPIYDGWEFREKYNDEPARFSHDIDWGSSFKGFVEYFGVKPKTVIDIGCNLGGMLIPYKEDGASVYGVEIYDGALRWADKIKIPVFNSIEQLQEKGIKADLLIMQDVLEHFLDLDFLNLVPDLLSEDGYLYVGLPGLFSCNLRMLFQNAHVWQFVGETLCYVMSHYGFEPIFLSEDIHSIWVHRPETKKSPPPKEWTRYIIEHLEGREKRLMPPIHTYVNTHAAKRKTTTEINISQKFPDISAIAHKESGNVIIVGGGPSVDDEIGKIRELHGRGYPIFSIERMYPCMVNAGLIPKYVASLDGNDDVIENFINIQPATKHLLGSTTHETVGSLLKSEGAETYLFSVGNSIPDIDQLWTKHGYTRITLVSTGGSITLTSIYVALLLGFRNIHLFGFDCMVQRNKDYASGITGKSVKRSYFEAEIDGEIYITCASFISFARQFFVMIDKARKAGLIDSIDVYGESLVNKMWRKPQGEDSWPSQFQPTPSL